MNYQQFLQIKDAKISMSATDCLGNTMYYSFTNLTDFIFILQQQIDMWFQKPQLKIYVNKIQLDSILVDQIYKFAHSIYIFNRKCLYANSYRLGNEFIQTRLNKTYFKGRRILDVSTSHLSITRKNDVVKVVRR